jgi:hypothetical protein
MAMRITAADATIIIPCYPAFEVVAYALSCSALTAYTLVVRAACIPIRIGRHDGVLEFRLPATTTAVGSFGKRKLWPQRFAYYLYDLVS